MKRGPKPGNVVSEETKRKISETKSGRLLDSETKKKISESMCGRQKSQEHRENISHGMRKTKDKYIRRYQEICDDYPEEKKFFEKNKDALLETMEDVWSERELADLRKHIESYKIDANLPYEYPSTSIFAAEDIVIELLDFKRQLVKDLGENLITH